MAFAANHHRAVDRRIRRQHQHQPRDGRCEQPVDRAVPHGIQVAFQSNAHALWDVGDLGNRNTGLAMRPGSSPSIMATTTGDQVSYVGPDTTLWEVGSLGTAHAQLGVAPNTSPSINFFQGGSRITLQGGDGVLWTFGAGGNGQVMSRT